MTHAAYDQFRHAVMTTSPQAVCHLMEAAVQAVYLIVVADLSSAAAIPNQAQFARANLQAISTACEDLIHQASNQQKVEVI